MALRADHADLPKAQPADGVPPDPTPRFSTALLDALEAQRDADGEKATAGGTRIRHSDAGKCARAIALKAAGFPREPMDPAGVHVTNLGTLVHDAWQEALRRQLGEDNVEVEPTCQVEGLDASGHIDAIIYVRSTADDDDAAATGSLLAEGGGEGDRLLGVDGGHDPQRLRGDGSGDSGSGERPGSPSSLRDLRGTDPRGDAGGSSVSESEVRPPAPSGGGDASGEHHPGDRVRSETQAQDALPEGSSLQRGQSSGARRQPEVQDMREGEEPSRLATKKVCYELKTVGGFGYKKAVGERGAPEGPKPGAVAQACLNAYAADCDELVIGYLATEAISRQAAERAANKGARIDGLRRFTAEWTYTRDQIEAHAKPEVARLQRVLDLLDDGYLAPTKIPDPEIPDRAFVVDPATGQWVVYGDSPDADSDDAMAVVDSGQTWHCAYCDYQSLCAAIDTAGPVSVDTASSHVEGSDAP